MVPASFLSVTPDDTHTSEPPPSSEKAAESRWTDDRVTIEKLRADDAIAWHQLIIRLGRIAKDYLKFTFSGSAHVLSIGDAEEIASILAAEIYREINTLTSLDHLEAYFRTGLRRDALDLKARLHALKRGGGEVISLGDPEILASKKQRKSDEVEREEQSKDEEEIAPVASLVTPANLAQQNELRKIIFDCAAELDLEDRKMLFGVYLGKSHAEIALEMEVSTASVGSRLQRIYAKLRPKIIARMGVKGLKDYGITID